ncbi:MAG TPA: hypothetical protein ENO20_07400 [Bacteroides sp.]|nr:hypothetical protein [Bacteroides sp.]
MKNNPMLGAFTVRIFIILSITAPGSCEWMGSTCVPNGVELYLLESYETVESTCQIDQSTAELQKDPLIKYADFLSYDSCTHIFKLSEDAKKAIENMEHAVDGVAFGVTADDELIYTGYFWPAYSSLICNWICIDPLRVNQGNELRVGLGYPVMMEGWEIPDKRNDPRILKIFKEDGKLVE